LSGGPTATPLLLWLTPTLLALLLYGLGQGFVKMWITEVPPARFCLYFACARAAVMICYYLASPRSPVFASEGGHLFAIGVLAYLLDGAGWIMYFESIIAGPITIVGTLSAAYPALTIVFARWFFGETRSPLQCAARKRGSSSRRLRTHSSTHMEGVVHGDVKPGNIMVTREFGIKVIDFGWLAGSPGRTLPTSGLPAHSRPPRSTPALN
jgi:uncharacterized membrane protein